MPEGDLVTKPYSYEWRDLLFGSGTQIIVERIEGILGLPGIRSSDDDREDDHGLWIGNSYYTGRTIQIAMAVDGSAGEDIEIRLSEIEAAFQISKRKQQQEYKFVTQRPGHTKRFAWCRVRRPAQFPSDYSTAKGLARGAAELVAADPRFYSLQERSMSIALAATVSSDQAVAFMEGNFEDGSDPYITITGPATNPRIQNSADNNRSMKIDVVLGAGQTLVLDPRNGVVTIDGVNAWVNVRADNQWWVLVPGQNTIVYSRDAGNTGATSTLTLTYRDSWTGA